MNIYEYWAKIYDIDFEETAVSGVVMGTNFEEAMHNIEEYYAEDLFDIQIRETEFDNGIYEFCEKESN